MLRVSDNTSLGSLNSTNFGPRVKCLEYDAFAESVGAIVLVEFTKNTIRETPES